MVQRYTVFLNEKTVLICQDNNLPENSPNEMVLNFTDKHSLVKAYNHFYENLECVNLIIKTGPNFKEACDFFNSMFTRIEAAGGIIRNQKKEYLFIKRLGVWDLPKGKLHKREPVQDGALREVTEETGLMNLEITKQLPSTYHIYPDRKGREILKETYWFEMFSKEDQKLVPQLEEDITEVKWFSASDLNIPLQNTYASLRQLLESYLKE
jgi:ADP-ribose pyrophosphatase YjhB (NUDIX family)